MAKKKLTPIQPKGPTEGAEQIIKAAEKHGQDSDPDFEVGDLQVALREAWKQMTPYQRAVALSNLELWA